MLLRHEIAGQTSTNAKCICIINHAVFSLNNNRLIYVFHLSEATSVLTTIGDDSVTDAWLQNGISIVV